MTDETYSDVLKRDNAAAILDWRRQNWLRLEATHQAISNVVELRPAEKQND